MRGLSGSGACGCPHCELLPLHTLRSRKALFEEGAFTSVPRGSSPASTEAERRLHSWGSQLDLLEGMETGDPLSSASPSRSVARSAGSEARSVVSSPQGTGLTLRLSSSEEELLEVVTRAVEKSQSEPQKSKLDERFLRSRPPSARRSLPFIPDLQTEVSRSWSSPFSARLFIPASYNYGNVAGLDERGYRAMPRVEQTLASYLSPGSASSLKAPALPSKPLRVTSALVSKGYTAAGLAGACLHTMSVLQAYQADLLKELDEGEEINETDIVELKRTADLALRATKETARAIGRSMAALVAAERHLWLTLSDMKEKDRVFLLGAPLSPSGLFGDSVNSVVNRYQEAHKQVAAFQRFLLLRHPAHGAAGWEQPRPSTSSSYMEAQKQSVASRSPLQRERVVQRSKTAEGSPIWGEAGCTASFGVRIPPVPSGGRLANPASASGRSDLQRASASVSSARKRSGAGELATPEGVSGAASSGASCRETVTGHRSSGSSNTRGQSRETGSLSRSFGSVETTAQCVLHTVERGYRIQFGAPPLPFNGVSPTLVGPEQGLVMEQEVGTLLRKEAIEVVPPHDRESGFYSRYFIVPKKDGGLRPILDLRVLNRSVMKLKFKMLTVKQAVSQIRSEDWFVTIDLKDAYFHVSILPQHRKFLRFAFRGKAYQYRVLPFGLALSPRTFTKCMDAALAPLRLWGIRILNYIDDWLILAQSEQVAAQHRDVVLAHMKELGLRLNAKKSVLSPSQRTTYLGVVWDSTTMRACLSPTRNESILAAVKRVKEGQSLTVKQFQQLLGLMAAASNVIPFGLLYMRPLQWWLKTRGFSPRGNPLRMIKVTRRCLRALDMWRKPWFLSQGPVLGNASDRCFSHRLGCGHEWPHRPWSVERDRHVLVRTDNTAVVSYVNHQGGLRSCPLYKLAHQIRMWSQDKLLSLRAVYLPGYLNLGADILSRQGPRPGGMDASPRGGEADLENVWSSPSGSLCHEREHAMSPLVLSSSSSSPGAGCHGTDVAEASSVRFSPDRSAPGSSRESAPGRGVPPSSSPDHHLPPSPGAVETLGVASEGAHLLASGLSTEVVETILQSRAPSTRKLYALKWKLFTSWCGRQQQDPVNCPVGTVLEFLQDRLSAGLTHSTLKVYVAAIAAYHTPLGGLSVGKDPLVTRFLRGALRPPVRSRVPSWDLSVVLEALCRPPFEPIEEISDLAPSFLDFAPGLAKAFLHPCPGYIPKVPSSAPRPVVLQAFCPPPFREPDQQKLNCMCPVRALDTYVHRAAMWRKLDQLFVCYGPAKRGLSATKQTLSRWIVDAISCAYESSGLPPPLGVKAHSTRSVSASKAFLEGVSMQDICNAAGWSTPLTFAGTWILAAWASRSHSVSTRLEFLEGNVSGYVCNPGSPRERDAASRGHPPASLRALLLS
ncbi:Transposon Ty3-G Gag-Pol polyprotein [Labeo rohita]|uniref:ribonuclease H n=1 Tax=Labeo rohita TaxID=84645 RepID=A0ABQ8LP09_LABRO|nr:Transposon Ty3-G Gag-Pol polyprotein [Labeo rohita]